MMHRVLIVGNSLFAETLLQMLAGGDQVQVIGLVATLEQVPLSIAAEHPDAVIVADSQDKYLCNELCLRVRCDLPIIYTTLKDDYLTIFTSQRVKAAQSQLLAAIATLPIRSRMSTGPPTSACDS
jgi:hypothetical protein